MKTRPEIFQNERVSASAGSGKTYALTKRFIALAAKEIDESTNLPDPSRIVALTFTRKSAGEFLGKILTRLSDAAQDENEARKLSLEIEELSFGEPRDGNYITKEKANELLRQCVKNLNRIRLSTIDSFFSSALKVFANESGVFSGIRIIDTAQKLDEKNAIIEDILRANSIDKKTFTEFVETVKRASFGAQEKSLRVTLKENIDDSHKKFIEVPHADLWGNIEKIIENRKPIEWDAISYQKEIDALKLSVENENLEKPFTSVIKFFEQSNNNTVGKSSTALERIIDFYVDEKLNGDFSLPYNRKEYEISAQTSRILHSLLTRLSDAHIARVCDATKAAAKIAHMYETRYAKNVRAAGKLSFDDIPVLLNNAANAQIKLLEYRLDARFKHWLFDEFQDTSREQWKFFKNIIDETIIENDGEKTFYYVGDVKQSLYSWRGGDRLLFDEIFTHYNSISNTPTIVDGKELVTSWRSGKNVIDTINAVFANLHDLEVAFKPQAAQDFHKIFTPHISAETLSDGKQPKPSLSQLRLVNKDESESENILEEIFKIVKETRAKNPTETCAILVNNNNTAQNIIEFLRARIAEEKLNIDVSGELEKNVSNDNMLVPAFMQTLKLAAHPSDTAALQYLAMTPLSEMTSQEKFREQTRTIIAEDGFEKFAQLFADFLLKKIENPSDNTEENIERLKEICREFDKSELNGIDNFLRFIAEKHFRISSESNAIQVMTIHKSKGLGFGSVILPDLHKIRNIRDGGLKYITKKEGTIFAQKTISYFPPNVICNMNPALRYSLDIDSENEAFENICKLYVALTRSERALYVVIPKLTKYDPSKTDIKQLLVNAFDPRLQSNIPSKEKSAIYKEIETIEKISIGDESWWENISRNETEISDNKISTLLNPQTRTVYEQFTPSKTNETLGNYDINKIEFGNAIHKTFEFIDGDDCTTKEKVLRAMKCANIPNELAANVEKTICAVLNNQKIAEYFKRKDGQLIKTEFKFDALIDGKMARGSIDRLLVQLDKNYKPISAVIIDFKSNGNLSNEKHWQLDSYKRAIEKIFAIKNITAKIISYTEAKIYDVR